MFNFIAIVFINENIKLCQFFWFKVEIRSIITT